jgi:beta-phosphoglucomutase-like phosphatase (HAD superfamily)
VPQVKLVIFDLEGTTVNDPSNGVPIEIFSLNEAIQHRKQDVSIDDLKEAESGNPLNFLRNLSASYFSEMYKDYVELLNKYAVNLREVEGVGEIFQWLRGHEIKISLVSIMPVLIAKKTLNNLRWIIDETYDYWTCSELVDEWRPSPIMIRRSMRHCHIRNVDEVIKVSSSPSGLLEGKNAGVSSIAIKSNWFSEEELKGCKPETFFQDFREMLGWLKLNFV